jgi:putative hemolysin
VQQVLVAAVAMLIGIGVGIGVGVARPGGRRRQGPRVTEEQLRDLVAGHATLGGHERRLIEEVFAAGDRQVREVMLPRTEVEFLPGATSIGRAARLVETSPHSRFPVVGESQDDVIGFVHLRDLLGRRDGHRALRVGDVLREVPSFPGTKRVLAALSEMRRDGHHLAIVVDEYGGTDGIVTLEDLIEELIGEIRDEYDAEPADQEGPPGVVDGLANLDELRERTGLAVPPGPYETAGGFVMAALGRLPVTGDVVALDGWRVAVTEVDGRRVARLWVTPVSDG